MPFHFGINRFLFFFWGGGGGGWGVPSIIKLMYKLMI